MSEQALDFRDYLIRQQQQDRLQQINALFPKSDEDRAADQAERRVTASVRGCRSCSRRRLEVEEALTDVITQARDLRKKISNGLVSDKDARETLGNLRKLRAEQVARTASIKTVYEGATRDHRGPGRSRCRVEEQVLGPQTLIMPGRRVSHSEARWALAAADT